MTSKRLLRDEALVDQARGGDWAAFDELYVRHATPAWRLARVTASHDDHAPGAVAHAFATVLTHPETPSFGLRTSVRGQLLGATRNAVVDQRSGETVPSPRPAADGLANLPELWRSALWLTRVEGLASSDAAPVLGLTTAATEQLSARAHAGLRDQAVESTVGTVTEPTCRRTVQGLAEYAAGDLPERATLRVRRHLDACAACRDRLLAIDDVVAALPLSISAPPADLRAAAEAAWVGKLRRPVGPLHITLPSGRTAPPWAERALASAAATLIALGITSAVLSGGRTKARDDVVERRPIAEQPMGSPDGESALVPLDDLDLPGSVDGIPDPASLVPSGTSPADVARGGSGSSGAGGPAPPAPGSAGPVSPPAPAPPGGEPAPPPPPTTAPPPPPPAPSDEVTIGVEDVLEITLGESCVGIQVGSLPSLGCDPATTGTAV